MHSITTDQSPIFHTCPSWLSIPLLNNCLNIWPWTISTNHYSLAIELPIQLKPPSFTFILNNLLLALDNNDPIFLSLLNCSAAFDLVDHDILLNRLHHRLDIAGPAHNWFRSYLTDRSQAVFIDGSISTPHPLKCGVPQGSTHGPKLFTIYTLPVGDIIRKHDVMCHLYTDNTHCILPALAPKSLMPSKRPYHILRSVSMRSDSRCQLIVWNWTMQRPSSLSSSLAT